MNDDLELSRELTAIIVASAGVVEVYPSGTIVQAATLSLVNLATSDETHDAKVAVARAGSGAVTVTATIGVDASVPAPDTLRSVSDALRVYLTAIDPLGQPPIVNVNVSRIET